MKVKFILLLFFYNIKNFNYSKIGLKKIKKKNIIILIRIINIKIENEA